MTPRIQTKYQGARQPLSYLEQETLPLFKLVAAKGDLGWCNETLVKDSLAIELLDLTRQPIHRFGRLSHLYPAGLLLRYLRFAASESCCWRHNGRVSGQDDRGRFGGNVRPNDIMHMTWDIE
jgi:hypothetical protein